MRSLLTAVPALLLVLLLLPSACWAQGVEAAGEQNFVPGQLLVRYKPGVVVAQARHAKMGVQVASVLGAAQLLNITDGASVKDKVEQLRKDPSVLYAEPNYRTFGTQTFLGQQWHLPKVSAPAAWGLTRGSSRVRVCVHDSGLRAHPDIAGKVAAGYNVVKDGQGPDNYDDPNGHGTHVAGIIVANGLGIAGVAADVALYICRSLDRNKQGDLVGALKCAQWCRDQGVHISSNSWTFLSFRSQALHDAIKADGDAGILFVAAAGNENVDMDSTPHYPAAYALDNVVAVAASDANDNRAGFSNFGKASAHLAAPGVNIYSLLNDGRGYTLASGTSMAAPVVTGALVLMRAAADAAGRQLTHLQLRDLLLKNVDPVPALAGLVATGGRLNVHKAVLAARGGGGSSTSPEAPPVPGNPSVGSSICTYTVKAGDTLRGIAQARGTTLAALRALNPGVNPNKPRANRVINVPCSSDKRAKRKGRRGGQVRRLLAWPDA